jgi:hypothetical protein
LDPPRQEEYERLGSHLLRFYQSVELGLAMVENKGIWVPLYFLAKYDYLPSQGDFTALFDTSRFRILSGSIALSQWEDFWNEIAGAGELSVPLAGELLRVQFRPQWNERKPSLVDGYEVRHAWNNRWWPQIAFLTQFLIQYYKCHILGAMRTTQILTPPRTRRLNHMWRNTDP